MHRTYAGNNRCSTYPGRCNKVRIKAIVIPVVRHHPNIVTIGMAYCSYFLATGRIKRCVFTCNLHIAQATLQAHIYHRIFKPISSSKSVGSKNKILATASRPGNNYTRLRAAAVALQTRAIWHLCMLGIPYPHTVAVKEENARRVRYTTDSFILCYRRAAKGYRRTGIPAYASMVAKYPVGG